MNDKEYKNFYGKKKKSNIIIYIGLVIVFLLVLYPFFLPNIKYQIGNTTLTGLKVIGGFIIAFGSIMILFGILGLFLGNKTSGIKGVLFGIILILFGMWMVTGFMQSYGIGASNGSNERVPTGYH